MVEIKTTMHVVDEYLKKDRDYKDKQWVSLENYEKLNEKIDDFITTFMSCKEQEE